MDIGLAGGMLGSALGVMGGAVGTYFSIKNTAGPRERSLMIGVSVAVWIAVSAFLAGVMLLPPPFNLLTWVPYVIALLLSIRWLNRRHLQIRAEEAASGSTQK